MTKTMNLEETTRYIFSLDWDNNFTDEELDNLENLVEETIDENGWQKVYESWCAYLHNECKDEWSVVNFALHYWDYAHDRYIPDPVHFIAYLYYRVDTSKNERACEIFDSLSVQLLSDAGLINAIDDPCYAAENDPNILSEIEEIKKTEQNK
ncbi:MAG: hypothetical protein Q4D13_01105 [Erysipelotrichaceae bacterium]|nr:hypothetical protein [Erysipelotrichaceae bacterium]